MAVSLVAPALTSSTAHATPGSTNEWGTPQALFDLLNDRFRFDLDAAASEVNAKHEQYFTKDDDALSRCWNYNPLLFRSVWLNPPYGRDIGKWLAKAYEESREGAVVVVLTFARTDTRWWHDYAMKASEVMLIKGRVKFERDGVPQQAAPAPSCVLVFTPWCEGPPVLRPLELP